MSKVAEISPGIIDEKLQSVQFIVGQSGDWTAVVVPAGVWSWLLAQLEDLEDAHIARERWADRATRLTWPTWEQVEAELFPASSPVVPRQFS